PVIPEAPAPPLQMEGGMLPPAGWQGPSPVAATPGPKYGVPAMPSAPGISGIIQILFRLLPLIFARQYNLAPIWPRLSFVSVVPC
ncbi:MAG TPA: hypothetical protein VMC61_04670, partial [Methanocella sp.]|nr:hypothetical protein [Methanocella sp.]